LNRSESETTLCQGVLLSYSSISFVTLSPVPWLPSCYRLFFVFSGRHKNSNFGTDPELKFAILRPGFNSALGEYDVLGVINQQKMNECQVLN
jgi:hypothetical protein